MKNKVAILGTGLAGAFAFQACKDLNVEADVYSNTFPGKIPSGAVWFHWLPFEANPMNIGYIGIGTEEIYLRKQWGEANWKSSFPSKPKLELGYSVEKYLPKLWEGVEPILIEKLGDHEATLLAKNYELVVQTFPTETALRYFHEFRVSIPVLKTPFQSFTYENMSGVYKELRSFEVIGTPLDVVVVYNGISPDVWVRRTYTSRYLSTEFPHHFNTDTMHTFPDEELSRYPDLHPKTPEYFGILNRRFMLTGRYATWNRKALSHQTYSEVSSKIKSLIIDA